MSKPIIPAVSRRSFIKSIGATTAYGITARAEDVAEDTAENSAEDAANKKIGIGVIGCGGRGNSHIRFLQQLKEDGEAVEITAVCDVYSPRLQKAGEETGAKTYTDYHELLNDPNVNAILITSPDHWHGYQLLDALKAGKDVYCEKPLIHWRQEKLAKQLLEAKKDLKQIVQVGTQCMSSSAWSQAARMIKRGDIGKPLHVQAGYFRNGEWGERMPIDDDNAQPGKDLSWENFLGDAPQRPFSVSRFFQWRLYWDYAGGPSTDLFPHTLTPIQKMLGVNMPETITASGGRFLYNHEREVPDVFNMTIDYPEEISVVLMCCLGNDHGIPTVVRGSEGTITFEKDYLLVTPQPNVKRPKKVDPIQRKESQMDFWKNFLSCCRTRKEPWSPLELAYPVQIALQMGIISLREQKVTHFSQEDAKII